MLLLCLRQSQLMAGWLLRMLLSQSEGGLLELLLWSQFLWWMLTCAYPSPLLQML
jgi:hypothetical protein